jgi:hypothetical protein
MGESNSTAPDTLRLRAWNTTCPLPERNRNFELGSHRSRIRQAEPHRGLCFLTFYTLPFKKLPSKDALTARLLSYETLHRSPQNAGSHHGSIQQARSSTKVELASQMGAQSRQDHVPSFNLSPRPEVLVWSRDNSRGA